MGHDFARNKQVWHKIARFARSCSVEVELLPDPVMEQPERVLWRWHLEPAFIVGCTEPFDKTAVSAAAATH
jgi:hypothetical protein